MARVFVLGAGASKAVLPKAPLNDQLLASILSLRSQPRVNLVKQFLQEFFEVDVNPQVASSNRLPPLEDVLSQLDSCIVDNRPLSSAYPLATLIALREALVYSICRVLKQSLRSGELHLMTKFIKNLGSDDTIISLNYDLIADNSLMHTSRTANYGIPIRRMVGPRAHFPQPHKEEIKLYKLHGSLNWLYCPACQAVDLTPWEKGAVYIFEGGKLTNCPICAVRYDPVIITPTFLKNYNNHYIGRVWVEAEGSLQRADQVIFVGYSLPDADIVLRTMFARAVYRNRLLNGRSPFITVVDWNEELQNPTRDRYERLFGYIDYSNKGFREYVGQMDNG